MAIDGIKQYVDCELEGRVRTYHWNKAAVGANSAGVWYDTCSLAGNPKAKFWFDATPLAAKQVKHSTDTGIFVGDNVSPRKKYLAKTMVNIPAAAFQPMPLILCDYLLYYPTTDDSVTDEQVMNNTETLPRYEDGDGVMVLPISTATRTGGASFYITYTNSDGVSGRVSPTVGQNSGLLTGAIMAGANTTMIPYMALQAGDRGVRSIESLTMVGTDTGLMSLVLVKPLAEFATSGDTLVPYEKNYLLQSQELTEIKDDAYLGYLINTRSSWSSAILRGSITVLID